MGEWLASVWVSTLLLAAPAKSISTDQPVEMARQLSARMCGDLAKYKVKRVAVLSLASPWESFKKVSVLGDYLAETITDSLFTCAKAVELSAWLDGQVVINDLESEGYAFGGDTLRKIGDILKADVLILGTIREFVKPGSSSSFDKDFDVTVRGVRAKDARLLFVYQGTLIGTSSTQDMHRRQGTTQIRKETPVVPLPQTQQPTSLIENDVLRGDLLGGEVRGSDVLIQFEITNKTGNPL